MVRRRFDVFRNLNPRSNRTVPYVVLLQSELLDELPTQVVAPLVRSSALGGKAAARLNPQFEVDGEIVFMLTQQVGAVPTSSLSSPVSSLSQNRDLIVAALDFLFSGI